MSKRPRFNADDIYNGHLNPWMPNGTVTNIADNRLSIIAVMYQRVLSELAMNRFKWHGLPDSVDERFMEKVIFTNGMAVFYWDRRYGKYLALQGTQQGDINMEGNYSAYGVHGTNFPTITLSAEKCVPIYGNAMRTNDYDILSVFVYRLADLEMSLEINGHNARKPRVAFANENQQHTVQNINDAIDRGDSFIALRDPEIVQSLASFDLGVSPDNLEKLDIVISRQWNKALMLLGINGANQDKKERLVASEVDANNEQVAGMRQVALKARQYAADAINAKSRAVDSSGNKIWGGQELNVTVEFDPNIDSMANAYAPAGQLGGDSDLSEEDTL